jgi:membrane protease YdiL (CAAX protease family)
MSMGVNFKKVLLFIGITFGLSLVFHTLIIFTIDPKRFLGFAMIIPLLSAVLVQKVIYRTKLFSTLGLSIGRLQWYFIAIIIPISLSFKLNWTIEEFLKMILIGVTISTLSALLEEVAWRGFLRNELNVVSKVKAYFVTALIWSTWHIPIAVLYRYTDDIFVNTTLYCGQLFLFSLIMNWIRDKSNSVIPASLFHGMLNVFYF